MWNDNVLEKKTFQYYRIAALLRLEGASGDGLVQPPRPQSRVTQKRLSTML